MPVRRRFVRSILGILLAGTVALAACHDHECRNRETRCHAGEMQECHCETVSGMIAANTCTEAARWRPVGSGVLGCIETETGPLGSRESCPERGMADFCEADRAVHCEDAANGVALAFPTACREGETCQVSGIGADAPAECVADPAPSRPDQALLLYTSHPVEWEGERVWAPALVAHDAELSADSAALVVLLRADGVRAYRGGSIPIALQGTRIRWPRPRLAEFLEAPTRDGAVVDALVSDASRAIRFQSFFARPVPDLAEVVRASALWYSGDASAARSVIESALSRSPDDPILLGTEEAIRDDE